MRSTDLAEAVRIRGELRSGAARSRRIAAGVSGADVARVLGVSAAAVFYWEAGQNVPTVGHALAYGRVLAALERPAA